MMAGQASEILHEIDVVTFTHASVFRGIGFGRSRVNAQCACEVAVRRDEPRPDAFGVRIEAGRLNEM